jgi:hypothetical protein
MGRPDSTALVDNPWEPGAKFAWWYYPNVMITLTDRVIGVRLDGSGLPTRRGLRIGDSAARVTELYGPPADVTETDWWYRDPADSTAAHVMLIAMNEGVVRWIYLGWYTD